MCGIAGFTRFRRALADDETRLREMGDSIAHRGPDAHGEYIDESVALAHRRLAIIDLSETGKQPMHSSCGRYVMVYNGEIYNYLELRQNLEKDGHRFIGQSDSEVVLAMYGIHGQRCVDFLNGMFAIAIWDTRDKTLFLSRDRLGKKPLYYYRHDDRFVFGSEIKAILQAGDIDRTVRDASVKDFFTFQYVPDPHSIFTHIQKLPPAHSMLVSETDCQLEQYWDVSFNAVSQQSEAEIGEQLLEIVDDATRLRMVSDVPLGAFLSGGVDSSAVVALMSRHSSTPVTTCAIGFDSKEFDEVAQARQVAEQFACNHHEFTVKSNVEENLIDIAAYFDEPFSDPSFVPTYFVSQLARQEVTVALAGDGGDENFAGYSKYRVDRTENRLREKTPDILIRHCLPQLASMSRMFGGSLAKRANTLLSSLTMDSAAGFHSTNSFFNQTLWQSAITPSFATATNNHDPEDLTRHFYNKADTEDHLSRILYTDIKTYLPGDILVKVDRMSMANSLETRAPLLDYRVVEYAATIPSRLKLSENETKHIFKKSLESLLTEDILYRKKMGFSVPLANWLRQEIKAIAEKFLFANNAGIGNYFQMNVIRDLWDKHQGGKHDFSQELWSLLVFELWWQRYIEQSA